MILSNVWLVSFADSRMHLALKRVRRQALKMGFDPSHILAYDEHDLSNEFRILMKSHLVMGSRGFGYWCWKPQVALQALEKMNNGDVLIYMDAGCHLNKKGLPRLYEYIELTREKGFIAFQIGTQHTIGKWTKGDLLDYFNIRENKSIVMSPQCEAGVFLCSKSAESINFLMRWLDVFLHHFNLIDDSPSISPNLPEFVENRHDQSVYAIMCKLDKIYCLPAAEIERLNDLTRPILARRDKDIGWRAYIGRDFRAKVVKLMRCLHLHR